MSSAPPAHTDLAVVPLGAGDLVDRAIRFYRKFFRTFILIAAPPVVIATVLFVGWTMLGRYLFTLSADSYAIENTAYYAFVWLGSALIWFAETVATLVVMGGASRNFVRHLLFGEPITFRETYQNVARRLGGLVVGSTIITAVLGAIGLTIFYMGLLIGVIGVLLIAAGLSFLPVAAFAVSVVFGLAVAAGTVWVFFLAASRLAYVPQVMLVEGQGVFAAIGRSASLAGRSVWRLAVLFLFSSVAAYSALALLYVPLAWYAAANDVPLFSFDQDLPAWYEIAYNLIWQISFVLLSPVWMIGLCLLYVDERVRREGYDIELMAAARLGDIPDVPSTHINPLQPALAGSAAPPVAEKASSSKLTTLGLK